MTLEEPTSSSVNNDNRPASRRGPTYVLSVARSAPFIVGVVVAASLYSNCSACIPTWCTLTVQMGSYLSLTEDSSAPAHAKPTFSPKFLAKYHVVRKIGEGGFGCAFEVRDRFTNAVWCAKTIRSNSNAAMSEVRREWTCQLRCYALRLYRWRRWRSLTTLTLYSSERRLWTRQPDRSTLLWSFVREERWSRG